ncbi:MAG TPA: TRAP transporter substrate-binding protein [Kiritimatiellia bacterium]|nr:TRAP transporter substrate-binding protein [Kiritimatiellia bacterium]HRU69996.1 TRAP transporter substrate-binding protein [Kiritimatiellia bacterium]
MKYFLIGFSALFLLVCGCGQKANTPKIFRIAYAQGPTELLHLAALRMARQIEEDSGGALKVRLYPSGQLGNEREIIEGLKLGCADMIVTGGAVIGWYAPEYGAFEAPFVWRDYAQVERAWAGQAGTALRQTMEQRAGIRLLSPWFRGPRYLSTTSRKVLRPSDLKGLKLRVPELEVFIKSWQVFGANVTPIPFTDMFMALKLGVVEGQENPLATVYANHLHEVQKYIMETRHLVSFYLPALGPRFTRRFTEAEQACVMRAFEAATAWHNQEVERAEVKYRKEIEAAGVEFVPLDVEPFRKLARERIPAEFKGLWKPGLYEQLSTVGD